MRRLLWILLCASAFAQGGIIRPNGIIGPNGIVGAAASGGGSAAPVYNASGTFCNAAPNCTVTQSISSGHLIVADVTSTLGSYSSFIVTDSNSDTFSNCPQITDAAGTRQAQIWYVIAGAAITTVTITITGNTGSMNLSVLDYTNPGALATGTIIDQCIGSQNENVSAWTTTASAATTNATDMFHVFMWTNAGTYSPCNTTSRTGAPLSSSYIGDLTTSVTGAQTGTCTLSTTGYGPAVGAAFK